MEPLSPSLSTPSSSLSTFSSPSSLSLPHHHITPSTSATHGPKQTLHCLTPRILINHVQILHFSYIATYLCLCFVVMWWAVFVFYSVSNFAILQCCRHASWLFPPQTGLLFRLWGSGGRRLVGIFFYSERGGDSHENHHYHCWYLRHQLLNFDHSQVEDECGDIPMVLVQNKIDLISQSEIDQWVALSTFKLKSIIIILITISSSLLL